MATVAPTPTATPRTSWPTCPTCHQEYMPIDHTTGACPWCTVLPRTDSPANTCPTCGGWKGRKQHTCDNCKHRRKYANRSKETA